MPFFFSITSVLGKEIGYIADVVRAKRPSRLPVVLTRQEVKTVLSLFCGTDWVMATLLYGAGLRLMECMRLRVKDIDFSNNQITVRSGKGDKDRHAMLPTAVKEPLAKHVEIIKEQHRRDLERGLGRVALPNALDRKYPTPEKSGAGNGYFPQLATTRIGKPESNVDITCTNPFCRR